MEPRSAVFEEAVSILHGVFVLQHVHINITTGPGESLRAPTVESIHKSCTKVHIHSAQSGVWSNVCCVQTLVCKQLGAPRPDFSQTYRQMTTFMRSANPLKPYVIAL